MRHTINYSFIAILLLGAGVIVGMTISTSDSPDQVAGDTRAHQKRQHNTSPYAGQEAREVAYLAASEIQALKEGKGAALGGLAKPAELNSYPGPRHALDLSEKLGLTDKQKQKIQTLFEKMKAEAQPIGQQFLGVEEQIDNGYAQEVITDQELNRLLAQSGDLYGKLRYVHLKYHFQTKEILTQAQIERYDELRGYASHSSSHHSG